MKKSLLFAAMCAATFLALSFAACSDGKEPNYPPPPEIAFESAFTVTPASVSLTVKTAHADKAAWLIQEKTVPAPAAADVLTSGQPLSGGDSYEISADGLKAQTEYTAYAVSAREDLVSELAVFHFTTAGYTEMLTLLDGGRNFVTYHVEVDAGVSYRHLVSLKAAYDNYLAAYEGDVASTVNLLLSIYGSDATGPQDLTMRDLQENPNSTWKPYDVVAGMPYVLLVRAKGADGNLTGAYEIVEYTTDAPEILSKTIRVEIENISSIEADFMCTPDEGLVYYFEQVYSRQDADKIIAEGGGEALRTRLITNGSRVLELGKLSEWGGLVPETEYVHHVLGVDANGDQTELVETAFTTPAAEPVDTEDIVFAHLYSTNYYGETEDSDGKPAYNYYFIISDQEMTPDEYNEPHPGVLPCNALNCDIYATAPVNGELKIPEGTYAFAETYSAGTWHPDYTWAKHFDETADTEFEFASGTIAVAHEGEGYRLTIALETKEGKAYTGTYTGAIPFVEEPAYSAAALHKKQARPVPGFRSRQHR